MHLLIKTLHTGPLGLCGECEDRVNAKCRFERATWGFVFHHYPAVLCSPCRAKVRAKFVFSDDPHFKDENGVSITVVDCPMKKCPVGKLRPKAAKRIKKGKKSTKRKKGGKK